MSGTGTTEASDTNPPPPDSSGDGPPPPPTTDTGECPYGTEGCLCDVGAACDDGLSCNDEGICVAPPACRPIDTDPHGDEDSALALEDLGCGMGADLGVIGTLEGPEVDWYVFAGNEAFMCPERPAAAVSTDITTEVCVFLECASGGNVQNLQCEMGSMNTDSPDGRVGCCGQDQAGVFGYDCSGFGGKDVDVWISVGTDEEACSDYAMSYAM